MPQYRLSAAARCDIIDILGWTQERFGEAARRRYEALIIAALRTILANSEDPNAPLRPELGDGVRSWHLRHSREQARGIAGIVRRPGHFLLFRTQPSGLVEVGRVLHDAMEVERHRPTPQDWE